MNLPQPVTIQPPSVKFLDGTTREFPPFTVDKLNVTLHDNATARSTMAQIDRFPQFIVLWLGDAYDAAGDYTQAQAEARILELLGADLKTGLERLFFSGPPKPQEPVAPATAPAGDA
jgi:hypothetical protein